MGSNSAWKFYKKKIGFEFWMKFGWKWVENEKKWKFGFEFGPKFAWKLVENEKKLKFGFKFDPNGKLTH